MKLHRIAVQNINSLYGKQAVHLDEDLQVRWQRTYGGKAADGLADVAVLAGGGIKHIDKGMDAVKLVWRRILEEYLNRCDAAGLDRRSRSLFPAEAPY